MAAEIGSSAASAGAKAALNSFMNPSIDIVKTIPQGIIELVLRGTNVVSHTCMGEAIKIKEFGIPCPLDSQKLHQSFNDHLSLSFMPQWK